MLRSHPLSWLVSPLWKRVLKEPPQPRLELKPWHAWVDLGAWCVAGATFGALIATGYLLVVHHQILQEANLIGVCGPPWILLARVIASVVFVAFAEFVPGADANLEYQARFGGIFMLAQFGWLIWFSLVLLPAPGWVSHNLQTLFATGTVSGAFSVFVGFTSKTAALIQQGQGLRRYLTLNTLAKVAAGILQPFSSYFYRGRLTGPCRLPTVVSVYYLSTLDACHGDGRRVAEFRRRGIPRY